MLEQRGGALEGVEAARRSLAAAKATRRDTLALMALGEVRPGAMRLAPERKRLYHAIRMATYDAATALCW